jgi:hypothetical protein
LKPRASLKILTALITLKNSESSSMALAEATSRSGAHCCTKPRSHQQTASMFIKNSQQQPKKRENI